MSVIHRLYKQSKRIISQQVQWKDFMDLFYFRILIISVLLTFSATLYNYIIDLPLETVLTTAFLFVGLVFTVVFSLVIKKVIASKVIFILLVMAGIDGLWITNGGIHGPVMLLFMVFFTAFLFFTTGKLQKVFIGIFVINILAMVAIQVYWPQIILGYSSPEQQLLDYVLTAFVFICTEIPLIFYAQKKYRLAIKKAEESEHLKSSFLANMSHEIRTPMNSILGFSEILRDIDLKDPDRTHYLDIIKENGKVLLQLLNNIIELSKLDANLIKVKSNPVHLRRIIEQISQSFKTELDKKPEISSRLVIPNDQADLMLSSDEIILFQIISNLFSNAIKYTNQGLIQMGYHLDESKKSVIIFVSDTGIGIKEGALEYIFERFRQGDDTYTREYSGSGLGLSICKELVSLLNGKIWVESQVNSGSTFYISIPLQVSGHAKLGIHKHQMN